MQSTRAEKIELAAGGSVALRFRFDSSVRLSKLEKFELSGTTVRQRARVVTRLDHEAVRLIVLFLGEPLWRQWCQWRWTEIHEPTYTSRSV